MVPVGLSPAERSVVPARRASVGSQAAAERLRHLDGFVWLDSSSPPDRMGRYSYMMALPSEMIRADGRIVTINSSLGIERAEDTDPWDVLRARIRVQHGSPIRGLPPFQGGLAGFLGYDMGRHLERVPACARQESGLPDLMLGVYDWVLGFDHVRGEAWLMASGNCAADRGRVETQLDMVEALLAAPAPKGPGGFRLTAPLASNTGREAYCAMVDRALRHITAGDIYQVNLSHRMESAWDGDPFALYAALRRVAPAPYSAYIDFGETKILSASPERFLRLEGKRVETRPIKGTRPRSADGARDREMAAALLGSEKDRAENLMIVDLLRNDLGRVCEVGTVAVPEMFALEGLANVWHLVSTVTGDLAPGRDPIDLLRACFPGGSVTGCPKIRAMEIIDSLEPVRRGPYCGAVVVVGFDGFLDSSIVIRTIVLNRSRLLLQVGGAVVADSDPNAEYEETMAKASSALRAMGCGVDDGP